MSSTDKKDYGELEQSMWQRFQDAEATPGPEVWSRIDHALAMQETEKYKKRALFYRQLAAACFILFVLAGSALLLHYKQDQELLATTATQQTPAVGTKPTEAGNAALTSSSGMGNKDISLNNKGQAAGVVKDHSSEKNNNYEESTAANYTQAPASPAAGASQVTIAEQSSSISGLIANNEISRAGETGILSEMAGTPAEGEEKNFVPASQAIASVPDDYTSPSAINPLLRRNATLGTVLPDDKAQESISLQKQSELALALNTPPASDKEEKTTADSRWDVGMGYGSAYFSQNINIPGYTVTPRMLSRGFGPDPVPMVNPGPSISEDSEINMRDARIEFKENTQAAMSFNVDVKTGFRIGKRLKLLTGLGYSQNTSKTKTSYIVEQYIFKPRSNERLKLQPSTVFLPSLHTFTTDSISVIKTKEPFDVDYSYEMLSIPVGVQVEGNLGQKWFWYAAGSAAVNFLMQTTIKAANPEIASVSYGATEDSPFRKVQYSGNIGLGIGKRLSDAVTLSFGPEFRSFFNSMLTDDKALATQGRPYTIGMNMGVNYMLGDGGK